MYGQGTKWRRNIVENFNRLSSVHERYRRQTDRRATTYSKREHEFTFAKNEHVSLDLQIQYTKRRIRRIVFKLLL